MPKKVFIFEFVSGGGFNKKEIPTSLLCEGFSMLRSLVNDFEQLGCTISTLLDRRLNFFSSLLKTDNVSITLVGEDTEFIHQFKQSVKEVEFCFIIAPEFSEILKKLTQIVEKYNKTVLSIDTSGIALTSSKFKTYEFFQSSKVPTPETHLIPNKKEYPDTNKVFQHSENIPFPIILKPDDGVGAESIFYFSSKKELKEFFHKKQNSLESGREYILQSYVSGRDLSISLLNSKRLAEEKEEPFILSVNTQEIHIKGSKGDSEYFGGLIPAHDHITLKENVISYLQKMDFNNFFGIFGIDFIYSAPKIHFIEINPRLTTSYIGLRYALNQNPVELLIHSNKDYINPDDIQVARHSIFKRVELEYIGTKSPQELQSNVIPTLSNKFHTEFITPPFSLKNEDTHYSCFIATREKNKKMSLRKQDEIYTTLRDEGFLIY
jgi:predicted ATP-grasp superfamily ATP-dependent carboligase